MRIIKGLDFLEYVQYSLNCGDDIQIEFSALEGPVHILAAAKVDNILLPGAVIFTTRDRPREYVLLEDIGDFIFTQFDPYRKWVAEHISKECKVKSKTKTADEFFEMVQYSLTGLTSARISLNIPETEIVSRIGILKKDDKSITLIFPDDDRSYVFFDPDEWEFHFVEPTAFSDGYYTASRKDAPMPYQQTDDVTVSEFESIFVSDTFSSMKPVTLYHQKRFWTVMQVSESLAHDGKWLVWLKDHHSDDMTRLTVKESQTFTWMHGDKCWRLTMDVEEITDLEKIKQALRKDGLRQIFVSGVEMQFIRCQEITKGVLFFVFKNKDDQKEYFYAGRSTKLRIFTNLDTMEEKYCLDHARGMRIG